ncbi:hypothetical protein TrCOL_g7014 [Triparma columacea]|uniref:CAAX prenyl protease 2/Lysostaphin resistance protein A-like domain-containing protein n=1 Tax=Triparma columacea TaxID=722753 RepID=A0A9W7G7X7_9STRA|nr:hypothetical protein TrCOL_g7014 [Triparma columacea]
MTRLEYKTEKDVDVGGIIEGEDDAGRVNFRVVKDIVRNQGLLYLGSTFTSSRWHWENYPWSHIHINPPVLYLGAIIGAGVIGTGKLVETSTWGGFGDINKSTVEMVLRVFGREKGMEARIGKGRMLEVAILAAVISLGTAIAEETCFRGQLVSGLAMSHDPATSVVLGAVLFGLAHVNLGSSLKDNMVTIGLHTMTGAGFGTAFILGGGNLAGCIAAHAIYDFQVFYDTWYKTNIQMDYAEEMGGDGVEVFFHKIDTKRVGTLGRKEVERGLGYALGWAKPSKGEMDEIWGGRGKIGVIEFRAIVEELKKRGGKGGR